MGRILVVDDDRSIRRTLEKFLRGEGHEVATAAAGREALSAIEAGTFDVVLLDLGLPEMDGLDVLAALNGLELSEVPAVIVITARDDMQSTVRAVQLGAFDYLIKPLDIDRLKATAERAMASRAAARPSGALLPVGSDRHPPGSIIGRSAAIREIYKTIGAVSTSRASVLVLGESGTGKELVARAIHEASARGHDAGPSAAKMPFVAINCSAFARELLESELFGHVRGAFTGAIADKPGRFELAGAGTLFLDEIAEMPVDLQAKLLRVLQERTFERVGDAKPIPLKARIVAATHRDLEAHAREGKFREDLLYRLKVVELRIPPLRERPEDIPLLVEALVARINREVGKNVRFVSEDAMRAMLANPWPGNVRELENSLTRAVVMAKGEVLDAPPPPVSAPATVPLVPEPALTATLTAPEPELELVPLREVEKRHIERVLLATGWNKRRACGVLDISRPTLDRKIEEYGLQKPGLPGAED